jgi:hypothetical protein
MVGESPAASCRAPVKNYIRHQTHASVSRSLLLGSCDGNPHQVGGDSHGAIFAKCSVSTSSTIPDDTIDYVTFTVTYYQGPSYNPLWSMTDQVVSVIDITTHAWVGSPATADVSFSSQFPYSMALGQNTASVIGSNWHWFNQNYENVYLLGTVGYPQCSITGYLQGTFSSSCSDPA